MRIYISGPLQGSHDLTTARRFYDELASLVERCGHEAYVPHHNTDPVTASALSPETVFRADLAALSSADAVIAHVGQPSTGVGAELALACASGRRVLGLKRPGERGSRFAEGLVLDAGGRVCTFEDDRELEGIVRAWLGMPAAWFGQPSGITPHRRVVA